MDTKQTKTIGEHAVAAELARREWAPALTRDGLERTDILAVEIGGERRMIEVQVKAARGAGPRLSWPLGTKSQYPSLHGREWFVMVAIDHEPSNPMRFFVVPRDHVAAAAWIEHMAWLTETGIRPGQRNAPVDRSRVILPTFEGYENRWDLLRRDATAAPVLFPPALREKALRPGVGLPPDHPWHAGLPRW